jgi:hypothetical protein
MHDGSPWGASIRMVLALRDRSRFLSSIRNLIHDVCTEQLEACENTSQLQMAVNELLENIVKYSSNGRSIIEFELALVQQQPTVRVCTQNAAEPRYMAEVQKLLDEVNAAADPMRFYETLVAASGERSGSGLGLVRIRAEAGLSLQYVVIGEQLRLEATGPVAPKGGGQCNS